MRNFLVLLLAVLLCSMAVAQVNPPLPTDIITLGGVKGFTGTDSLSFTPITVGRSAHQVSGLIIWAKEPFRYRATFVDAGEETPAAFGLVTTTVADTAIADMRGDVEYPVKLILPGAYKFRATSASGDTLHARPYYR